MPPDSMADELADDDEWSSEDAELDIDVELDMDDDDFDARWHGDWVIEGDWD